MVHNYLQMFYRSCDQDVTILKTGKRNHQSIKVLENVVLCGYTCKRRNEDQNVGVIDFTLDAYININI